MRTRANVPIRHIPIIDGICHVPLSQGKVAHCDEVDYPLVSRYNWSARKHFNTFYAVAGYPQIKMHRLILGLVDPVVGVDHKDGNGWNNVRSNIRIADVSQNGANRRLDSRSSSGFKGVSFSERSGDWKAYLVDNRKYIHLGCFPSKEQAALAYNEAAVSHFGEFAKLNLVV